jgi:proline dehydrogenase
MKSLKERVVGIAGSRYTVGERIDDAMRACARLTNAGYNITLCYWDGPPDKPEEILARYEEALAAMKGMNAYLSVKAPSLDYSLPMFERLADKGPRLHFDGMWAYTVDRTFDLIGRLTGELSCTLPGRWHRSDTDAERALEMGLPVRVVKGQFKSEDDRNPEKGFLSVVDRLAGRAKSVAVASHDQKIAAEALRRLRAAGTPCELEQLYGIPLAPPPARVYVPYGHALLPYAMVQVLHNPKILWWLARDLVLRRKTGV